MRGRSSAAPGGRRRRQLRLRSSVIVLAVVVVVSGGARPAAAQPTWEDADEVSADGAVLWDPADEVVLWGREEAVGRRPASTTKILTVLAALEAGAYDDTATISAEADRVGRIAGGATLNLREGDEVAMRALLAGLMLRSGNDAAVAVAEHIDGSEAAFVERMNRRIAELDLPDTAFLNASGLIDDPAHRASPLGLAQLAAVAMADERFAELAGAAELTVAPFGTMRSRNELLFDYPGATGVKTGFTNLAGLCLVASATRDGRTLYAVVLGSEDSFADTAAMLDHGFDDFRRVVPAPAGEQVAALRVAGAEAAVAAAADVARTVPVGATTRWRAAFDPVIPRPRSAGDPVGTAELLVDDEVVASAPLVLQEELPARPVGSAGGAAGAAVQEALRGLLRLEPAWRDV